MFVRDQNAGVQEKLCNCTMRQQHPIRGRKLAAVGVQWRWQEAECLRDTKAFKDAPPSAQAAVGGKARKQLTHAHGIVMHMVYIRKTEEIILQYRELEEGGITFFRELNNVVTF